MVFLYELRRRPCVGFWYFIHLLLIHTFGYIHRTEGITLPIPPTAFLPLNDYYQYILQLRTHVPDLISPVFTYGRSYEGIPLQGICLGQCRQSTVPGHLITAMHHGREPMGAIATLHFVKELVEQYLQPNPSIVALLRTRRLYIILSVNPDAYQYNLDHRNLNQVMARKNRHDECTRHRSYADTGTDLNRNYDFAWNIDDVGSSPLPCAEDYRGSGPFSEPETIAIKKLLTDYIPQTEEGTVLDTIVPLFINSTIVINWHSYARFINLPYAVSSLPLPPENIYNGLLSIAEGMSKASGYGFGHPWTGGLYTCNGEASDWMIANRNLYAFSPEIGPQIDYEPFQTGMWPTNALIPQILHDALPLLYYSYRVTNAHLVIPQYKVTVTAPLDSTHVCGINNEYICAERKLAFEIANKGIWKNKGSIVISSMHHTGLSIPLSYYTKETDGSRGSIHIDKLENYVYVATSDSNTMVTAQITQHHACYNDYIPTNIASSLDGSNDQRRRLSVDNKEWMGQPSIPSQVITELQSMLRTMDRGTRSTVRGGSNVTQKWDMRSTVEKLRKQYTSEYVLSSSSSSSSSSFRKLGGNNNENSLSPFLYSALPFVYGYRGISKSFLQEFHSYGESVISLSIDIPFVQPAAGGSFPNLTPLDTDSHGYWGYLSVNDENSCILYGMQLPSSLTDTTSTAVLHEVYNGLSSCFPCAAFRQKAYGTGDDIFVPPSPSPSPASSNTPGNSPSPSSASVGGVTPSAGNSKEPWKYIIFPGGENSNDPSDTRKNDDIWPWSTASSLNNVTLQISLILLGTILTIGIIVFRSHNIIQFRLLRPNPVVGRTERSSTSNGRSRNSNSHTTIAASSSPVSV